MPNSYSFSIAKRQCFQYGLVYKKSVQSELKKYRMASSIEPALRGKSFKGRAELREVEVRFEAAHLIDKWQCPLHDICLAMHKKIYGHHLQRKFQLESLIAASADDATVANMLHNSTRRLGEEESWHLDQTPANYYSPLMMVRLPWRQHKLLAPIITAMKAFCGLGTTIGFTRPRPTFTLAENLRQRAKVTRA